jgi:hypothetical protein
MTYQEFVKEVEASGWTLEQLRFDVKPPLLLMQFVGDRFEDLGDYEKLVLRYERARRRGRPS